MKRIVILGSTGQIGTKVLEVVASYPNDFEVIGLACKNDSKLFRKQVEKFKPKITAVTSNDGDSKLEEITSYDEVDLVIIAVVGMVGLVPTLAAIRAGKDVGLATKEVLVVAGELVMAEAKKYGVNIIPIDSEHSAIFQSLKTGKISEVKKLMITMGSGNIAKLSKSELEKISYSDVCKREVWSMGQKIAVDSATCVNKVFEVIEASYLFGITPDKVSIVVHPEYVCHSLVEFVDGSIITEFGSADMRRYVQYALFYPNRKKNKVADSLNIFGKTLTFVEPDEEKFPCLKLSKLVLEKGGNAPAILHGADRALVDAFISGKIKFTDFYSFIKTTIEKSELIPNPTLEQLVKSEEKAFQFTINLLKKRKK